MVDVFVTFGQSHVHRVNGITFDCDSVALIVAPTFEEGRAKAFEYFGPRFFTTYPDMPPDRLRFFGRGVIRVEPMEPTG